MSRHLFSETSLNCVQLFSRRTVIIADEKTPASRLSDDFNDDDGIRLPVLNNAYLSLSFFSSLISLLSYPWDDCVHTRTNSVLM